MKSPWSKSSPNSQKALAKTTTGQDAGLNAISRTLRILQSEMRNLRQDLSILKRDVARIDRNSYRDKGISKAAVEAEIARYEKILGGRL